MPAAITNDVLATEIKNLSFQISDLKLAIAMNAQTFISHDVFELRMKEIDLKITEIDSNMRKMSSSRWIQNTLSAILGAVMSILIAFFFTHV